MTTNLSRLLVAVFAFACPVTTFAQVPVSKQGVAVVFERMWSGPTGQDYRVDLFSDGRLRYEGKRGVKTSGVSLVSAPPEAVMALLGDLRKLGFFEFQPDFNPNDPRSRFTTLVGVYAEGRTHALVYDHRANEDFDKKVRRAVERHAPTTNLRCPYVLPPGSVFAGTDVCLVQDN